MNALDILKYGDKTLLDTIEGLPDEAWTTEGVCGVWSVKEIVAHLTSFEQMLKEVLATFLAGGPTPTLDQYRTSGRDFNDRQVAMRKDKTIREVIMEYKNTHDAVMGLAARITPEKLREPGTIPWYGNEYSLDDFIVYTNYAHKREHCGQIKVYRRKQSV